jgi:hypothetical protein
MHTRKIWLLIVAMMTLLIGLVSVAQAAVGAIDNNVWWTGVYHDQTTTYLNPMFPTTAQSAVVKIRTNKNDLTGVTLRIWDGSTRPRRRCGACHLPIFHVGHDRRTLAKTGQMSYSIACQTALTWAV